MGKTGNGERPTMEMVATIAGVSTITVSRALRGSDLVRPELRERIAQIANQVGYRMNVAARSLRTRESRTIAVVIDHYAHENQAHADPLLLVLIGGLLEALTPANYAALLTTNEHFLSSGAVGASWNEREAKLRSSMSRMFGFGLLPRANYLRVSMDMDASQAIAVPGKIPVARANIRSSLTLDGKPVGSIAFGGGSTGAGAPGSSGIT